MPQRSAVAVYVRISQDRTGEELGVKRQEDDCRAEAERRGWTVAEVYRDDDLSAYSGKKRPAYERMLADLAEGRRDGVIVWHMDRLHRRPAELERFVDTCVAAGVRDVVTLSGDIDLAKGDGLLMARLLAAVAANESDSKRRRGARKALEVAQSGRPVMGGAFRPFGFADDRVTHHPAEAPVLRDLAARALAGETLTSLTTWLQVNGVKTVGGKDWRTNTVRQMLTNPRAWGQRMHRRQVIGPGTWEPIISPEDGERLRRLLLDPARRTNRSARRYLLTGLLRCGKCGNRLYSTPKNGVRRYGCAMGPDQRGCGGVFIYAQMLEEFVAQAVLYRLDSPDMHQVISGAPDEEQSRALAEAIQVDTDRLEDLVTTWADGDISKGEWLKARDRIEARREDNRRAFFRVTQRDAVAEYIGRGNELREQWERLNLSRQVAIVKALLDYATILPALVPGRHGLDPDRVVPTWRL